MSLCSTIVTDTLSFVSYCNYGLLLLNYSCSNAPQISTFLFALQRKILLKYFLSNNRNL